jgi:putative membrane protein
MTPGPSDLPVATKLALDRTRLAYERTLMAWVRTAASLISFGFTIYKFFQYLREEGNSLGSGLGPRGFGMLMIAIGLAALLIATLEHRQNLQALRAEYGPVRRSLATVVAGLVAILGVLGFVSVLLQV